MPEILEAEIWRRAAEALIGRSITRIEVDPRHVDEGVETLVGEDVVGVRRHGKVVLIDTTAGTLGLRFGMTGRLVVDGDAPIESLAYASSEDRVDWDRLVVFAGGGPPALRLNDPRRLGRVEFDPDLSSLGPDVLDLDRSVLAERLTGRRAGVKSTLMNQSVVAGLGNLCVDEVLYHAAIHPHRGTESLTAREISTIHREIGRRLPRMLDAGGSTEGVLGPERRRHLGRCSRRGCDGTLIRLRTGGRTSVCCERHQRLDVLDGGDPRDVAGRADPSCGLPD